MTATRALQLAVLSDRPDYRVCAEDTDPRGWTIVDANGLQLGTVADLIIDLEGLTARYMVCAVSRGHERSVLVPTGFARIENQQRIVYLDFVAAETMDRLPAFVGLPVGADLIARTEEVLTGVTPTSQHAKIVRRSDEARDAS